MNFYTLRIPHLLSDNDINALHALLADSRYADGKRSAGESAARVKHNLEADLPPERRQQVDNILLGRLTTHPDYLYAALPARVARPIYAKYETGMAYGDHVDNPMMGGAGARYRADLAITVFLNAPDEYDGGELIINSGEETEVCIKYVAGDAVVYPASTRHRINEVTRGERRVALTWVQSMVRDDAQRELLYRLWRVLNSIKSRTPDSAETSQTEWIYARLLRMWGQP